MAILVTFKYEEDLIKTEGARVATTQNIDFSNTQGQDGRSSLNFELIRDHVAVLVASKNEDDPIRKEGAGAFTTSFFKRSRAANSAVYGRILPDFELIRYLMAVLVT